MAQTISYTGTDGQTRSVRYNDDVPADEVAAQAAQLRLNPAVQANTVTVTDDSDEGA